MVDSRTFLVNVNFTRRNIFLKIYARMRRIEITNVLFSQLIESIN